MEFLSNLEFNILYIKALHIIFVTTWFAGLFYIVRLFIYHAEARGIEEPARSILQKQYKLMEWRLWYIITWPSGILTVIFGSWLIYGLGYWRVWQISSWENLIWLAVKLALVAGLFLYQFACHRIFQKFQNDEETWGSFKLRIWNEVATLFLFAIVFVVVLKDSLTWIWGLVGLVALSLVIMLAIKLYGKARGKKEELGGNKDESVS
ncbi:MAG: CopD family protein [Flavobacteriales bacterium]|nr:CopD family protein [Flavobacteriales bacterium]